MTPLLSAVYENHNSLKCKLSVYQLYLPQAFKSAIVKKKEEKKIKTTKPHDQEIYCF